MANKLSTFTMAQASSKHNTQHNRCLLTKPHSGYLTVFSTNPTLWKLAPPLASGTTLSRGTDPLSWTHNAKLRRNAAPFVSRRGTRDGFKPAIWTRLAPPSLCVPASVRAEAVQEMKIYKVQVSGLWMLLSSHFDSFTQWQYLWRTICHVWYTCTLALYEVD